MRIEEKIIQVKIVAFQTWDKSSSVVVWQYWLIVIVCLILNSKCFRNKYPLFTISILVGYQLHCKNGIVKIWLVQLQGYKL